MLSAYAVIGIRNMATPFGGDVDGETSHLKKVFELTRTAYLSCILVAGVGISLVFK